ncbi:MAG: alcohol dehydrogenase catalytic domain-containing protein [Candidatus Korobacteraceae bacterium]|jgi:L-iditol 2-dehydrogenase
MKASVLVAPEKLELRELPDLKPAQREIVIKVKCVGICGTDVQVYRNSIVPTKSPLVLGHEYCGEVAEVGSGVANYQPGDYVSSGGAWGCGTCVYCKKGEASYCQSPNSLGRTSDGSLAEYIRVPAEIVYPLDKCVTPVQGQGVIGVGTGLRAVSRAGVKVGDRVLLIGPGYGGLIMLQLSKLNGARAGIVGTRAERLAIAKKVGADFTENTKENPDWEKDLLAREAPTGFDVVIEAAGNVGALLSATRMVKKGGTVLEFGTSFDTVSGIPQKDFYYREISIVGCKGGWGFYRTGIELLNRHAIKIDPLITHHYPLARTAEAFHVMDKRLDGVLRAAVYC